MEENCTAVTEFILLGLSDAPELRVFLPLLFLFIYGCTVLGNLGMIALIRVSSRLHTPMYFFLSHLSFVDFCYSTIIVPKMLASILSKEKAISFPGCMVQFYLFCTFAITEVFLLSVMAYDRFLAICSPLLYMVSMSQKLSVGLASGCYLYGNICSLIHLCLALKIPSYRSNVINHFFCDLPTIVSVSCPLSLLAPVVEGVLPSFSSLMCSVTTLRIHAAGGHPQTLLRVSYRTTATVSILPSSLHPISERHTRIISLLHNGDASDESLYLQPDK
ncbi:PREDICTED: olfactory receptor 5L1-like [Condylura cristata]|uniref:olfactory receptor 5L1-like n=1 Tax=Condylura cristata TaxID=143302 RepID=UPI000643716F|nr:PREDICTED: olfactory receptor 5L1-like [Condylura cristata]